MVVRGFRRQWLAPFLILAAMFGGCRSATPVVAGADPSPASPASPASPTSTGPSVWSVDLMTVLPGEHDRYRRFIDANWARARRTAGNVDRSSATMRSSVPTRRRATGT